MVVVAKSYFGLYLHHPAIWVGRGVNEKLKSTCLLTVAVMTNLYSEFMYFTVYNIILLCFIYVSV